MDTCVLNISGKEFAEVSCPKCEKIFKLPTSRITTTAKEYKLRCSCGNEWGVRFNQRRYLRVPKNFPGSISVHGQEFSIELVDLALWGCGFVCIDKRCKLKVGDTIQISFNLDNSSKDLIMCRAVVRNIPNCVGVEFIDVPDSTRKTLAFYFR